MRCHEQKAEEIKTIEIKTIIEGLHKSGVPRSKLIISENNDLKDYINKCHYPRIKTDYGHPSGRWKYRQNIEYYVDKDLIFPAPDIPG